MATIEDRVSNLEFKMAALSDSVSVAQARIERNLAETSENVRYLSGAVRNLADAQASVITTVKNLADTVHHRLSPASQFRTTVIGGTLSGKHVWPEFEVTSWVISRKAGVSRKLPA